MSTTPSRTTTSTDGRVDELRAEIAGTREGFGDTAQALSEKADVKTRAKDAARRATTMVGERARGTTQRVNASVRGKPGRWAGVTTGVLAAAAAAVGVVTWRRNQRKPQRRAVRAWNAVAARVGR